MNRYKSLHREEGRGRFGQKRYHLNWPLKSEQQSSRLQRGREGCPTEQGQQARRRRGTLRDSLSVLLEHRPSVWRWLKEAVQGAERLISGDSELGLQEVGSPGRESVEVTCHCLG